MLEQGFKGNVDEERVATLFLRCLCGLQWR